MAEERISELEGISIKKSKRKENEDEKKKSEDCHITIKGTTNIKWEYHKKTEWNKRNI